jgi:hypothetical protein
MKTFAPSLMLASMFLVPLTAEARFGRADSAEKAEKKSEDAPTLVASNEHSARPVGTPDPAPSASGSYFYGHRRGWRRHHHHHHQPGVVLVPEGPAQNEARGPLQRFSLGLTGQVFQEGGASGSLALMVDGRRFGLAGELRGLALPAEDGSSGVDTLRLADGSLTFALFANPYSRLRLHLGGAMAVGDDITLFAPMVGLSGTFELIGPFIAEASAQYAVFPFTQLDGKAGLVVQLGPLAVSGGWRGTYLNDQGRADGVAHWEVVSGPYLGAALAF